MTNDNPYSKYRYNNTFDLKFRSNGQKVGSVYGNELKSYKDMLDNQLDKEVASSQWGITWVINNVFKATRTTNVDTSLSSNYKGPTYFKPFKL